MPYMLFPHTQIRGTDLTKIKKRFGDLTICQPWYMETPVTDIKQTDIKGVHIQNPDTALKPREDFNTLLPKHQGRQDTVQASGAKPQGAYGLVAGCHASLSVGHGP